MVEVVRGVVAALAAVALIELSGIPCALGDSTTTGRPIRLVAYLVAPAGYLAGGS